MRRFTSLGICSRVARSISTPALDQIDKDQLEREEALNARQVIFATATSSDNRPRQAVQEAFEVAASALPREPNFCMVNVSLDLETMIDAPEMVWGMLQSASNGKGRMMGSAVNRQRFGGGFIQVMLGIIPDLECDVFTMDSVPTKEYFSREGVPPAFACITAVDAALARHHELALHHHLRSLKRRLGDVPIAGSVLQPVGRKSDPSNDSISFFDDRVFKGSAVACVMRSNLISASTTSVVPSIELSRGKATVAHQGEGIAHVTHIDGRLATDVIREAYETHLPSQNPGKVFLGFAHNGTLVPLSFSAQRGETHLTLLIPEGLDVVDGSTVHLVCDDPMLDSELSAGNVMSDVSRHAPISVEKSVTVARESRKFVTASSCAGIHFSNNLLNIPVRRDDILAVGAGTQLFVPPVINRAVGRQCATAGFYCPAQIVDIGNEPFIVPRSSSNMLWGGKS